MWILSGLALLAATLGAANAWRADDRAARTLLAVVPPAAWLRVAAVVGHGAMSNALELAAIAVVTALVAGLVAALLLDRLDGLLGLGYLAGFGLLVTPWWIVASDGLVLEGAVWTVAAAVTLLAVAPVVLRRRQADLLPPEPGRGG